MTCRRPVSLTALAVQLAGCVPWCFVFFLAFATLGAAQDVPTRTLPPASGTVASDFTSVYSIRELSDGRLLIAETIAQRLTVANMARGTVLEVTRRGSGPLEYERVSPLLRGGGDTTIMPDRARERWLLLRGSEVVNTIQRSAATASLMRNALMLLGTDGRSILAHGNPAPAPDASYVIGPNDSLPLLIMNRATGEVDTIGGLRRAAARRIVTPGLAPNELFRRTVNIAWSHGETAIMCDDSWVGIVRSDPYRVDWRSADARWIRGTPISYNRVRVDRAEMDAYTARLPRTTRVPVEPLEWPTEVPPQTNSLPICAPDGRLFVLRNVSVAEPRPHYDIIDRRGVLVARLRLEVGQRIAGFGNGSMYVVSKDAVDLETISRHPYSAALLIPERQRIRENQGANAGGGAE